MAENKHQELIVAMTGASGAPYGVKFIEEALDLHVRVHLIVSPSAEKVLALEVGPGALDRFHGDKNVVRYEYGDVASRLASGTSAPRAMVVVPASMGTLGRIRAGISGNLIERAADVMLKEGRPLILVPRETPYSRIHLENMLALHDAGATILPASPGLYHTPKRVEECLAFVVGKIFDRLGIEHKVTKRWREESGRTDE